MAQENPSKTRERLVGKVHKGKGFTIKFDGAQVVSNTTQTFPRISREQYF